MAKRNPLFSRKCHRAVPHKPTPAVLNSKGEIFVNCLSVVVGFFFGKKNLIRLYRTKYIHEPTTPPAPLVVPPREPSIPRMPIIMPPVRKSAQQQHFDECKNCILTDFLSLLNT